MSSEETVRVIVRCRPLNSREKALKCDVCVKTMTEAGQVQLIKPGGAADEAPKKFTFDGAYGIDSNSQMIYEDMAFPLIESVLEGYNGTIFAYGQTGCGKSFTMEGIPDPPEHRGLTPRSFEHIFQEVAVRENTKFLVRTSYLEIYNENVRDLLSKDQTAKLELKEHPDRGVYVRDLTEHVVQNAGDVLRLMAQGSKNRSVGATLMNADSSRSHSIFTVWLEAMKQGEDGEEHIRASKLNLVDLAGSERQGKTGATGDRLKEATKINLSLSALGNVISALVDGKAKHIPYRDSKLTRLLQDSLGGNTKTLMVAAVSPADNNYDETLSTLRYANRAKNIKNKAIINEDPKDALLRQYQEEINQLKALLSGQLGMDPAAALAALSAGKPPGAGAGAGTVTRRLSSAGAAAAPAVVDAEVLAQKAAEREATFKAQEEKLKREYDEQLASLQQAYEEQRMTNEKLEQEFERLTQEFNVKRGAAREQVDQALANDTAEVTTASSQSGGGQTVAAAAVAAKSAVDPSQAKPVTATASPAQSGAAPAQGAQNGAAPAQGAPPTDSSPGVGTASETTTSPATLLMGPAADTDGEPTTHALGVLSPSSQASAGVREAADGAEALVAEPMVSGGGRAGAALGGPSSDAGDQPSLLSGPAAAATVAAAPAYTLDVVPQVYVVIDSEGQPQAAVRQAGSLSFYQVALGDDGMLHPCLEPNAGGKPRRLRNAELATAATQVAPVDTYPPKLVVAVGEGGKPLPAILGPDGVPVVPAPTSWHGLEAVLRPEDDELEILTGQDGLPAAMAELSSDATVVINKDGVPEVVLVTSEGLPVRAVFDSNGQLMAQLRPSEGEADASFQNATAPLEAADLTRLIPVLGPDGLPAQPVVGKLPCARLFPRPVVVIGSDNEVAFALLSADGVPVYAKLNSRKAFEPDLDANGKPQPVRSAQGNNATLAGLDDTMVDPSVTLAAKQRAAAAQAVALSASGLTPGGADENALVEQLQAKLAALEKKMVSGGGGETDEKKKLKEQLRRRKNKAEERRAKLREAIINAGDDGILEGIYDNLQDELKAKNKHLRKSKEALKAQQQEIDDLHSEFERERRSLLDDVRRSEQTLKFYQQYLDRVLPTIRRDCNYSNFTKIRNMSVWNEEDGRWVMPKLTLARERLPESEHSPGTRSPRGGSGHRRYDSEDDPDESRLRERLAQSRGQPKAYFQGTRQKDLLGKMTAREAQIADQMDQKLHRFDSAAPLQSSRSLALASGALDRSPRGRRRPAKGPGGVSLGELSAMHTTGRHARGDRESRQHTPVDDGW